MLNQPQTSLKSGQSMTLEDLKKAGESNDWLTHEGYETLRKGYLLPNETPRQMYWRVANSAAKYLKKPELAAKFYKYIDNNWLCLSTPVASNCGTERGLPISCLTGDMMINTPEGVKCIKDVVVGDYVLSHKGRYKKVTNVSSRNSSGDLYELLVNNRRTRIKITGNHPVKTNLGWVRVDELDVNKHLVAGNYGIEGVEKEHTLNLYKFEELLPESKGNSGTYKLSDITRSVKVNDEVAWLLGLWFAEGSITTNVNGVPNALRITMSTSEESEVVKWISLMEKYFGVKGNYYKSETTRNNKLNSWITGYVSSTRLAHWFTNEFGRGCKTKKPPQWVSELPISQAKAFLDAFILGDGHKKHPTADRSYVVLSNPFIIGTLYNLGLRLGYPMSVDFTHKKTDVSKYWHYAINFYEEYSQSLSSFNNKFRKGGSKITSGIRFEDGLVYFPIREIKKLDYDEEVFDLTVDEDHSFSVAGVVVHNCYASSVADNLDSIFKSFHEIAMLTKHGGGCGTYWGRLRQRGDLIGGSNGHSEGIIPWLKVMESTLESTSQGGVRRGSGAQYLDISSNEIEDFIDIRRPTGDSSRRCHSINFHHAVCIDDGFMKDCLNGNKKARSIWDRLLNTRHEMGQPYIMNKDIANRLAPDCYKKNNLTIETSNLCNEVYLYTDPEHTFVCCLSSLNVARYDEWKDTDLIETAIWFLDGIMEEFIHKAESLPGFQHAINSAKKGRPLGLGQLGWHTFLQIRGVPFESFEAMQLNAEIARTIDERSLKATQQLALEYGEPEWCKGFGMRNTHRIAIAPTISNSLISGGVSQGIEPIAANYFAQKGAKGTFIRKNRQLEQLLDKKGKNSFDIWEEINNNAGSVKNLDFLTADEKEIFATAREINQFAIIRQASQRQQWIDQGQSVNLFFSAPENINDDKQRKKLGNYIHEVHLLAWELGLKGLYYLRPTAVLKGDNIYREDSDCKACES